MGFFLKSTDAVGLEFDTGVIRFVKLKGSAPPFTLVGAGQIEIPDNAVAEGIVEDVPAVAGALEELWNKSQVGSREVTLGIFNQGVLFRRAVFPKLEQKKLAQVVRYQSDDYFPVPVSELVLDFAVVGELEGENGPALDVLLVAVQREILEKSLHVLTAAGLRPLVIDASPLALARTVPRTRLAGTVLVIDIANGLTTLFLVSGGVPMLARSLPHSLQFFARELDLPLGSVLENIQQAAAAAEEEARSYPAGMPGVFSEWVFVLANEIRSLINYYLVQNTSAVIDHIALSGRGARMDGLAEFLQEELDLPVETIKPLENIKIAAFRNKNLGPDGLDFSVSIGLALRGLQAS
ncbi:type IV pilus assembly protein PilM [Desulfofarcimen acetoxidans DSM 771]|uniref:Type IV pilus assembly protein PilM n=1 Tax=Desulfofarcimen acetoxidans (strain ATCC 49208 / DSM 771 / KCTC 5769 / VKM B-1644 / 5575) TaxID=485916 RepID=C8W5I8_DESAS|nr:type IV pilus assembly protein PilM [Desulfofarcimen acetoxidans]ACV63988.1 type IV pilus assembly protein PilM [Desulfofarcimen acetoxidans DSM 771]